MDFEKAASELTGVDEKGISLVSSLCKQQIALEDTIKDLKADLKQSEADLRTLSTDTLPAAMTAQFGRNEDNLAKDFSAELVERGFISTNRTWVEPQTLKSWAKEQLGKGNNLPHDCMDIYNGNIAKIRRK